jgi:hypothetical protein
VAVQAWVIRWKVSVAKHWVSLRVASSVSVLMRVMLPESSKVYWVSSTRFGEAVRSVVTRRSSPVCSS